MARLRLAGRLELLTGRRHLVRATQPDHVLDHDELLDPDSAEDLDRGQGAQSRRSLEGEGRTEHPYPVLIDLTGIGVARRLALREPMLLDPAAMTLSPLR